MSEHDAVADPSGLSVRGLLWGVVAIVGGILFALAAAWWAYRAWHPAPRAQTVRIARPLLDTAPQPDRAAYFAAKERQLDSTGWVDRHAGIAHIPIADAMRLMAQGSEGKR